MGRDDLPFAIEQWSDDDNRIEQVIARSVNLVVARAAFKAAVTLWGAKRLYLRNRAHVMESHVPARLKTNER
jgi:hypothetical protein